MAVVVSEAFLTYAALANIGIVTNLVAFAALTKALDLNPSHRWWAATFLVGLVAGPFGYWLGGGPV